MVIAAVIGKTAMATLDLEEELPDQYRAMLRYHSSRIPDDRMVIQLGESLQLAREMSNAAATQVAAALSDNTQKPEYQLAREVLKYHLNANVNSPPEMRKKI